jgi:hypothetical protein
MPDGSSLAAFWLVMVLALAIKRLPYALRACYATLQQISPSLEEAAENLGASKLRTVKRIVVPLMMGGMLAGIVTSFATSAVIVAGFLGKANILAGRVTGDSTSRAFEISSGARMPLPPGGNESNGNKLVFRPQHVTLGRISIDAPSALRGTVLDREFLGAVVRYSIDSPAGAIVCEQPFVGSDGLLNVGERVHGSIASRYLTVLAE